MGNFQSEIRYGIDPSQEVNLNDLTPNQYSIRYVKDGLPDYFDPSVREALPTVRGDPDDRHGTHTTAL